jgi:LacI family transcriptional regulator
MKISISQIAQLAGVSKTTVSFVLNGRGDEKNISQATQVKISEIAKSHHYQPNQLARSLSLGKSETLALVVPDISNPFYGKIARFIEKYAEAKGYKVMIASTGEDISKEQNLLKSFKARQIDGIVLASAQRTWTDGATLNTIPIVYFDRIFQEQECSFVDIDNQNATEKLTSTLINKTHKRIGLLTLTSYLPNINQRLKGYYGALKKASMQIDPKLVIEINYNNKKKYVHKALERLLYLNEPVTAVVFLNNVLAAEGIWAINTYWPELKDKIEFASFDNLDLFDYSAPKVISVLQPTEQIAQNCINMLCSQIKENKMVKGRCIRTKLIER